MKSLKYLTLIALAVFGNAYAETYHGTLIAPNNAGRDISYPMTINYEIDSDGNLKGTYRSWQSKTCNGERIIVGSIRGESIEFSMLDDHELRGCGKSRFTGKKEGNSLVGRMNFQGGMRDITFTKDK